MRFEGCRVGIDTSNGNTGFFALVDSSAVDTGVLVNAAILHQNQGSMVLENVAVDGSVGAVRLLWSLCCLLLPEYPG